MGRGRGRRPCATEARSPVGERAHQARGTSFNKEEAVETLRTAAQTPGVWPWCGMTPYWLGTWLSEPPRPGQLSGHRVAGGRKTQIHAASKVAGGPTSPSGKWGHFPRSTAVRGSFVTRNSLPCNFLMNGPRSDWVRSQMSSRRSPTPIFAKQPLAQAICCFGAGP